MNFTNENDGQAVWDTRSFEATNNVYIIKVWNDAATDACRRLFADVDFAERVKAEKFDIAFSEPLDICGFGFFKLINVTNYVATIPMSLSEFGLKSLGLPGQGNSKFATTTIYDTGLSFWDRTVDFVTPIVVDIINDYDVSIKAIWEYVDPNFTYDQIYANARYVFCNTEEHVDCPRPLKKVFKTANGVVVVSFGSIAQSANMPMPLKSALISLFEAFPEITFIWKYENDTIPNPASHLKNLITKKWLPQKQLLSHPKTLAFITHGGMNSIIETVRAGVPAITVPMFGDQFRNGRMLKYRGIGEVVLKAEFNFRTLQSALKKVISPNYQKQANDIAAVIRGKPMQPKERFIKYFEHAANFGYVEDLLNMKMRRTSVIGYYDLDLFGFFGVVIFSVVYVVITVARRLCRRIVYFVAQMMILMFRMVDFKSVRTKSATLYRNGSVMFVQVSMR
uniref:UDP-glucuronosyltransferase n=1 Tax=Panagrellus redivivus TaxID=6233 RepID=A0A7E4UTP5_PANRE